MKLRQIFGLPPIFLRNNAPITAPEKIRSLHNFVYKASYYRTNNIQLFEFVEFQVEKPMSIGQVFYHNETPFQVKESRQDDKISRVAAKLKHFFVV